MYIIYLFYHENENELLFHCSTVPCSIKIDDYQQTNEIRIAHAKTTREEQNAITKIRRETSSRPQNGTGNSGTVEQQLKCKSKKTRVASDTDTPKAKNRNTYYDSQKNSRQHIGYCI